MIHWCILGPSRVEGRMGTPLGIEVIVGGEGSSEIIQVASPDDLC